MYVPLWCFGCGLDEAGRRKSLLRHTTHGLDEARFPGGGLMDRHGSAASNGEPLWLWGHDSAMHRLTLSCLVVVTVSSVSSGMHF